MASCCAENHIATLAAVSAIRSALGDKLFPSETHAAWSTMSALHKYFCFINKFNKENSFFFNYMQMA